MKALGLEVADKKIGENVHFLKLIFYLVTYFFNWPESFKIFFEREPLNEHSCVILLIW